MRHPALILSLTWLPPCLGPPAEPEPEPPPAPPSVPAPPPPPTWPHDPGATWPVGCLLDNAATHPTEPWLALSCTNSDANLGAILVVDLTTATLRATTVLDDYVGWPTEGVLRWHPKGHELAANVGTNGIMVVEAGKVLGRAFPDETRDHPVVFVWVDDHLFADTGVLFRIRAGDPDRFDLVPLPSPPLQTLSWNQSIGAAVGRVGTGLAAFDPRLAQTRWTNDLANHPPGRVSCSADGRHCVSRQTGLMGDPDALVFVDGDTGRTAGRSVPHRPQLRDLRWGPGGGLLTTSYRHVIGGPPAENTLELFRDGQSAWVHPLGAQQVRGSPDVVDATGLAWSPDGQGVLVLLDTQEVQLFDARDGTPGVRFHAPAKPPPDGVPSWYRRDRVLPGGVLWPTSDRIVRLSQHDLTVHDVSGAVIGRLTMPTTR